MVSKRLANRAVKTLRPPAQGWEASRSAQVSRPFPLLERRGSFRTAPAPGHARLDGIRRVTEPHGLQRGADGHTDGKRTASNGSGATSARRGVLAIELIVPVFDAGRPTGRDGPLQAATDVPAP